MITIYKAPPKSRWCQCRECNRQHKMRPEPCAGCGARNRHEVGCAVHGDREPEFAIDKV